MNKAAGQLIQLDEARKALAKIASVDEAKQIRDKAEALRNYAKQQALGLESQNKAAEIKIRAERRAGELLEKIERTPPKSRNSRHAGGKSETYSDTIKSAGIPETSARRWQKEASVPEPIFESFVATAKDTESELTSASLVRLADSADPHKEIARQVSTAPTLVWEKNLGRLERTIRAFVDAAALVPKRKRVSAVSVIDRAISSLKKARKEIA